MSRFPVKPGIFCPLEDVAEVASQPGRLSRAHGASVPRSGSTRVEPAVAPQVRRPPAETPPFIWGAIAFLSGSSIALYLLLFAP